MPCLDYFSRVQCTTYRNFAALSSRILIRLTGWVFFTFHLNLNTWCLELSLYVYLSVCLLVSCNWLVAANRSHIIIVSNGISQRNTTQCNYGLEFICRLQNSQNAENFLQNAQKSTIKQRNNCGFLMRVRLQNVRNTNRAGNARIQEVNKPTLNNNHYHHADDDGGIEVSWAYTKAAQCSPFAMRWTHTSLHSLLFLMVEKNSLRFWIHGDVCICQLRNRTH